MKIDILTLFPHMFDGFLTESIISRAINKNKFLSFISNSSQVIIIPASYRHTSGKHCMAPTWT